MTAIFLALALAEPAPAFQLSWTVEAPAFASSALLFGGSLVEAAYRQPSICPCSPAGVPGFDQLALSQHSAAAGTASDVMLVTLLAVGPLGAIGGAAPGGWARVAEVGVIQAESMALSASLTELVKYAVARPRPYAYPTHSAVLGDYTSFWSGHSAASFNSVVTAGYLLHESYPRAWWPWLALAGGLAASATVATLRVAAGDHFPSDVVTGAVVGSGVGLLVPWLHLRRSPLQISAAPGGVGLAGAFD